VAGDNFVIFARKIITYLIYLDLEFGVGI